MPVLVATPGAPNSNSYVTRADADAFLDERLYVSAWANTSDDDKERALIWATRTLDRVVDWYGVPRFAEQSLRWPRSGVWDYDHNRDYDSETIPDDLARATAETALELLKRDRSQEPEILGQGFSKAKLDVLEVTVDDDMVLSILPSYILTTLDKLGQPGANATGGMKQLPLDRV